RIYTDLATGEVYRRNSIMAEGPAMGKLRQQEVLKDGKWTLVRRNSYDPRGRLIRSTQGDSLRILEWVKVDENTSKVTHYLNGLLDRVETIGKNGSIIYRETYKRDGL
ncbi:hypothetical protein RZS08_65945, partial [Arthrospira platensis SPKY1]|nr:hypothetical protein [Arthrospira platensis SPKY1]